MRFARPENPTRRRRLRPSLALPAVAVAVALLAVGSTPPLTLAANSVISLSGSHFEIDADANLAVDGTAVAPSTDWAAVANCTPGQLASCTPDAPSGGTDDSFSGKEDDPAPGIGTGSIPPNKSDLKFFGLYQEGTASNGFLNLFWSRVNAPKGTTNMDFELNQSSTLSANGVTPVRTPRDVLISYDLAQGGTNPILSKRVWTGNVWGPATDLTADGDAVGSINVTDIPAAGSPIGATSARTFGEAQIRLSSLFPPDSCESVGSAYVKSRSSDAFDAALKDFIAPMAVSISNCGRIIINKVTNPTGAPGSFGFTTTGLGATFNLSDGQTKTFADVKTGHYTVSEGALTGTGFTLGEIDCLTPPGGSSVSTSGQTVTIDLNPADTVNCTFHNTQLASITGLKYEDLNGDGTKQDSEPALAGFSFALNGGPTVQSDANGAFGWTNLTPGTAYTVTEVSVPTGWKQTQPSSGGVTVTPAAGENKTVRFGNAPLSDIGVTFTPETSPAKTSSTISCTGLGSPSTTGSFSSKGLLPGTYSCTVVITAP
jgi:hypothetical protein